MVHAVCQNPAEDCLIQLQYGGGPGRPVNQWIDWVPPGANL